MRRYIVETQDGSNWGDYGLIKGIYSWIILSLFYRGRKNSDYRYKWKIKAIKKPKKIVDIYVLERDNPGYTPEPEVLLDGEIAIDIVRREYNEQMKELGTSQEKSDAGYGSCGCYWNFSSDTEGDFCGDAVIDRDYDGDCWIWRITKHALKFW